MQQLLCPNCAQPLQRSGEQLRHCRQCDVTFKLMIRCAQCNDELQRLKACGSVSFWCNCCNELKSKSSAVYQLQNC